MAKSNGVKFIWQRETRGKSDWDVFLVQVTPGEPDSAMAWLSIRIAGSGAIQVDLRPDNLIELGLAMVKMGHDMKNAGVLS